MSLVGQSCKSLIISGTQYLRDTTSELFPWGGVGSPSPPPSVCVLKCPWGQNTESQAAPPNLDTFIRLCRGRTCGKSNTWINRWYTAGKKGNINIYFIHKKRSGVLRPVWMMCWGSASCYMLVSFSGLEWGGYIYNQFYLFLFWLCTSGFNLVVSHILIRQKFWDVLFLLRWGHNITNMT